MGYASYNEDLNNRKRDESTGRTIPYHKLHKDVGFSQLRPERDFTEEDKRKNKVDEKSKGSKEMKAQQLMIEKLQKEVDRCQKKIDKLARENDILSLSLQKTKADYGDLLMDINSMFREMKELARENGWFSQKGIREKIESLVDSGYKKYR